MAVSFTQGNDFIVPTEDGQTYLGGAGNDTYMLSDATIAANSTIVIQDTEGTNTIQLVGGLSIASSIVTSNALELTLSNGAKVQILGANSFGYDVGGNALAGVDGTDQTFTELVENTLGTTVPATGSSTGGTVEIPDTTAPATPTFSVAASDASVTEGGDATFTVSLSAAQGTATSVAYTLAGTGGAVLGTDTTTVADATLTFAAGETTKTITVPVTFDTTVETGEGMTLTLSAPSTGTVLGTSSAAVAFADPAAPTFTMTSNAVAGAATTEGNTITYTITPSSITDKAYTFTLSTAGDTLNGVATAAAGADFSPAASTVTFAAGTTAAQTVVQTIVADGLTEGLEGYKTTLLDSSFAAVNTITGLINDGSTSGTVGTTYTLTTLIDNVPGTSADDTVIGAGAGATTPTSTNADQVNGGDGVDTLKIYSLTAATDIPTLSNVEVIELIDANAPANLDLTGITALASLVLDNTTTTDDYLIGSAVKATVKNMLSGESVTLTSRATDTTADLTVSGLDVADAGTVTVNFDGAAITTVNLTSSGTTKNNLTFTSTGAETTVNVDGSAAMVLVDAATTITTFNATASTGGVTFDMSGATGASQALTGGSGNDTLTVDLARIITLNAGAGNDVVAFDAGTVAADLSSATGAVDSIVGGDGTDVLSLTSASAQSLAGDTAADLAVISGFEILRIDGFDTDTDAAGPADDFNIHAFGLNSLQITGDVADSNAGTAQATATISGFTSGATVETRYAGDQTLSLNIGMTGATNASTPSDTLNINLNANLVDQANAAAAFEAKFGVDGINILNVNTADSLNTDGATSRDDGYILTLSNATNVTNINVTGDRELSFTSGTTTNALTNLDAHALTGDLIADLSGFTGTQGVTVIGGGGVNTITGTSLGDIITGGARADIITGGAGADTLTGGAGADTFSFAAANFTAATAAALATAADKIADFASSSDIITWDANFSIVQNGSAIGGNAAINAEGFATFAASDDTLAEQITAVEAAIAATGNADGAIAIWANGTNSYAFISEGTNGVGTGDALIELTGVTGLSNTTLATTNMTIA